MRPRSYARKPTDAHMSSRTHPRAHTYIHPCTHTYARIRAREGNFLTPNLFYSIVKPSSIINPTPFTSIIQSLYNPYPYWHHIGFAICTNCCHLSSSDIHYHPLSSIRNYCPTIHRLLIIHSIICIANSHTLLPIISNSPSTHHIPSLSDFHSNQLTILSICQYVIKPYQFSIYLPHFSSVFSYTTDFCSINLHYNHFHYGNRIPTQSSAIPIMYNYSFINFRNEIRLKPFCIIIHLNCINIHSFGFHYGNHLLIIGFYYGIRLWDFIFSSDNI